jgi:hypothetical protein
MELGREEVGREGLVCALGLQIEPDDDREDRRGDIAHHEQETPLREVDLERAMPPTHHRFRAGERLMLLCVD